MISPPLPSSEASVRICDVCHRLSQIETGDNPHYVGCLDSGVLVMGDHQFFLGYCVYIYGRHCTDIAELSWGERANFFLEASLCADVLRTVTGCERVNMELLGNRDHHLHWHLFPRRTTDPLPSGPVWVQMPDAAEVMKYGYCADRHGFLKHEIGQELERRLRSMK